MTDSDAGDAGVVTDSDAVDGGGPVTDGSRVCAATTADTVADIVYSRYVMRCPHSVSKVPEP